MNDKMKLDEAKYILNENGYLLEKTEDEDYFIFTGTFKYESADGPILYESEKDKMEYYLQEALSDNWKHVKAKIIRWKDNAKIRIRFKASKLSYVKEDVSEIKKYIFDSLAYDMEYYGKGLECTSI